MSSSFETESENSLSTIGFERDEYAGICALIDGVSVVEIIQNCVGLQIDANPDGRKNRPKEDRVKAAPMDGFHLRGDLDGFEMTVAELPLRSCGLAVLRGCGCGYLGCGCIAVEIEISERHVKWSKLQRVQSKLGPYPGFETVVFDRDQYQAACEKLHDEYPLPRISPDS